MKKRFLLLAFFLLVFKLAFVQDISRHEADSMIKKLNSSKGIDRIGLLLNLSQFHIFKPGENQLDLDSALTYFNEASVLNKHAKSSDSYGYELLTKSYLLKEKGNKDSGKQILEQAITALKSGTNKSYLGKAFIELSRYSHDSLALRIDLVRQAINVFGQDRNAESKAAALTLLAEIYIEETAENEHAKDLAEEAITIYDSIKYRRKQGAYLVLGIAYLQLNNHSRALYHMLKALKIAQEVQDSSMLLCQMNNMLGIVYQETGRTETSLTYQKAALQTAQKYKDEYSVYTIAKNIAITYNELDQPLEALQALSSIPEKFRKTNDLYLKTYTDMVYLRSYIKLKDHRSARLYCDTLLQRAQQIDLGENLNENIDRLVAIYYFNTGQYIKAKEYLTKSLALQKNIQYEKGIIEDYRSWYKVDSARGDYSSAFNHLLIVKTKTDSLFGESKERQLQILGVEYETQMKEDSIKLKDKDISLLTRANNLQQANLKQTSLIKNITIAGIILAMIIIGMLYRQFKLKQKSSLLISQKNEQLQHLLSEKEWLVKEIHHRVKNNFQTVMGLLGTQSAFLKNEEAITAMSESQNRIQAMSLIHQRLYQSNNLSAIRMNDYIHELADSLGDSFKSENHITFVLDIDPIELSLAHCIPLGLILNEAITNSFKYAFPPGKRGDIAISFKKRTGDHLLLSIKDNGTGLPQGFDINKCNSMGMNLMRGLSAEIEADFTICNENGTRIDIGFTHKTDNPGQHPAILK